MDYLDWKDMIDNVPGRKAEETQYLMTGELRNGNRQITKVEAVPMKVDGKLLKMSLPRRSISIVEFPVE